ncbi:transglutaminase-like domain-containing protein [Macellibacteroides fermentans]|uniref:Transglutaminase-like putative cysteine protease n=2 Tax=Macellibacteroides fermentans TaxID=879969 RepID=A0A8E1ZW72_9PORP|nr:transglutaminase domain-containing protein [Macellibacteroides fermentans]NYI48900.1 transglutaminase-like putative cysteine protease [Macellibacteroides fermentans]
MKQCIVGIVALLGITACQQQKVVTEIVPDAIRISETERHRRIALDFRKDKESVVAYIQNYYPLVTDSMLDAWEESKALEVMYVHGKKCYFNQAAPNLFRIDPEAKKVKEAKEGRSLSASELVNQKHLPEVINTLHSSNTTQGVPVRFEVTYKLTVKADAVPDGEVIRCWLPYPREDNRRQSEVELLSASNADYQIAPKEALHRTLYMEKRAEKNTPTQFSVAYRFTSSAEWFDLKEEQLRPYHTESDLYKKYTAECAAHVLFTPAIRHLSGHIAGNGDSPLQKVRKIFTYINDAYPWASAREYSTVPNIPEYVIDNRHGDCGMVSLLFITLCRLNGIPAKWQSGFMLHPGGVNLHDWSEVYFEGVGWVPVDQSFGIPPFAEDNDTRYFFSNGIDAYRLIVNDDFSAPLVPEKHFTRSETVDFQRGEVEWKGGNLYFDKWTWDIDVQIISQK